MNLTIVKSQQFGNVQCDFWKDESGEIWMTREQIGEALEYSDPRVAIAKIHNRYKDRLDKFSGVTKLVTPGGVQETVVYNARGIYEICRWSRQPKADAFYDMVYDILESLRRGEMALISPAELKAKELEIKRMNAEARLRNARVREATLLLKLRDGKVLSPQAVELLSINALEVLTDKPIEYRPEIEKTYTATEIAKELGVSANKIGKIANAHGLKTAEYGITVLDKSPYSNKQVSAFRYNEKGRQKLIELVKGGVVSSG